MAKYEGEPWNEIESRLEGFFDKIAIAPLQVPFGKRPGYLSSGAARGTSLAKFLVSLVLSTPLIALLTIFLDAPTAWPRGSHLFSEAMNGDGSGLFNMLQPNISYSNDLTRLSVTCLDSPQDSYLAAEDLADEGLRTLTEVSRHFGVSTGIMEPDGGCQFWPVKGPERFTGPWNATLKIPMLIVANTVRLQPKKFELTRFILTLLNTYQEDPSVFCSVSCTLLLTCLFGTRITPISNALRINSHMPNSSVMLIQNGPGVSTFLQIAIHGCSRSG